MRSAKETRAATPAGSVAIAPGPELDATLRLPNRPYGALGDA